MLGKKKKCLYEFLALILRLKEDQGAITTINPPPADLCLNDISICIVDDRLYILYVCKIKVSAGQVGLGRAPTRVGLGRVGLARSCWII